MKTIQLKLYKFDELSAEAQKKAVDDNSNLYIDTVWWSTVYEDAKDVGLEIDGFDLDRANYCNVKLKLPALEVCKKLLEASYLPTKIASAFQFKFEAETDDTPEDEQEELRMNFERALGNMYLQILRDEYEYITADGTIRSGLQINEYDFTEDGQMYS